MFKCDSTDVSPMGTAATAKVPHRPMWLVDMAYVAGGRKNRSTHHRSPAGSIRVTDSCKKHPWLCGRVIPVVAPNTPAPRVPLHLVTSTRPLSVCGSPGSDDFSEQRSRVRE